MSTDLIQALQNPALYSHDVVEFEVIETHISWVLLTGPFAYKIKKPVDFGFLDFSTLDKRKYFCEQEVLLNRRLGKDLAYEMISVNGSSTAPVLGGEGEAIEYAVRMVQFDQADLYNRLLEDNRLSTADMTPLGEVVARFHANTHVVAKDSDFGHPDQVFAPVQQNFDQIRPLIDDRNDLQQLAMLEEWAKSTWLRLQTAFQSRKQLGHIRECHGDLHLGNITRMNGSPLLFDCIEFNEDLRFTDTLSDVAFLMMDLEVQQRSGHATCFLNAYLAQSGDYSGLRLLPFYKAYRAMVRAKIALLSRQSCAPESAEATQLLATYRRYTSLAESYCEIPQPYLLATSGYSGSGKSTVSRLLAEKLGLVHLRSDVERKRLFGLAPNAASHSAVNGGIYSKAANREAYARIATLARRLLSDGWAVIIDSAALRQRERQLFQLIAEDQGALFTLLSCETNETQLAQRLSRRQGDASEATAEVVAHQKNYREEFSDEELNHTLRLQTDTPIDAEELAEKIQDHLKLPI